MSIVLMEFNERFVPDSGPVCFSTLAEPWAEDRCNFLIIFIELAVTYAYNLGDELLWL